MSGEAEMIEILTSDCHPEAGVRAVVGPHGIRIKCSRCWHEIYSYKVADDHLYTKDVCMNMRCGIGHERNRVEIDSERAVIYCGKCSRILAEIPLKPGEIDSVAYPLSLTSW